MVRLSHDLSLPVDAVTQKQAFLGMSGSGKTYGAGVFVEGLLVIGALDPEAINKKMKKNRARKWNVNADGTAQHVGE